MNITIVGVGNIGTQFAVHCAEKGHHVIAYGSRPDAVSKTLCVVDENENVIHKGQIMAATSDSKTAFADADLIFITVPAYHIDSIAKKIEPYANPKMKICLVPGTGGGECSFKYCIENGVTVFGMQRVPSVARLVEYGKIVRAVGYRDKLHVAALPSKNGYECASIISSIFDMECLSMPNYLNLTLTPSNPILHTVRLRKLFENYEEGHIYKNVPLFYEQWDNESSKLLFACDHEVQELSRAIQCFDLSYVKSLKVHYESETPEALTRKFSQIKGFKGLSSPVIGVEGGFIPDFNSRYFTADFPYGLAILVQVAEILNVEHTNMKETLDWYYNVTKSKKMFRYSDYGIETKEQFFEFYSL